MLNKCYSANKQVVERCFPDFSTFPGCKKKMCILYTKIQEHKKQFTNEFKLFNSDQVHIYKSIQNEV
jgi:hypothetical protein